MGEMGGFRKRKPMCAPKQSTGAGACPPHRLGEFVLRLEMHGVLAKLPLGDARKITGN